MWTERLLGIFRDWLSRDYLSMITYLRSIFSIQKLLYTYDRFDVAEHRFLRALVPRSVGWVLVWGKVLDMYL